jgi:hypothetical protein
LLDTRHRILRHDCRHLRRGIRAMNKYQPISELSRIASPVLRGDDREAEKAVSPCYLPVDPFYSAVVRMLELSMENGHQTTAINLAKQYAAKRNLTGLQLALSVARIEAATVIEQIDRVAALFPAEDFEASTLVYGE